MVLLTLSVLLAPLLALIIFWGVNGNFSGSSRKMALISFLSGLVLAIPVKYFQSVLYPAGILNLVSEPVKEQLFFSFLIIALIEEGSKFLLVKFYLLRPSASQSALQSVTIALLMAMGFATFENAQTAYINGLSSYSQLMLLSVFAHASFSIIMAYFINSKKGFLANTLALLLPFFLHGLFIFTLLLKANPENSSLVFKGMFFGTVLLIYLTGAILFYRQIKKGIASKVTLS